MRSLFFVVLVFMLVVSCQQKKRSEKEEKRSTQKSLYQRSIEDTYNFESYQQKKNVALELQLINDDTVDVQIYLQPDNSLKLVKKDDESLYITNDRIYEKPVGSFGRQEVDLYQKLVQAYLIPYQLSKFSMTKATDTLPIDKNITLERSFDLKGGNDMTLFLSPKTNLIRSVAFKDGTGKSYLSFERYITVKQIPISMHWAIYKDSIIDQEAVVRVEVKKISYPEGLAFDLELPETAKPIQNK